MSQQLPHLELKRVYAPPDEPTPPDVTILAAELGGHEGFNLELEASDVLSIVSQLQLALRHPGNTGPSTEITRSFIHAVIETGFEHCPETQKLIRMGFEPKHDLTTEEFNALYPWEEPT
jgi:hypothetical protein